MEPKKAEAAQRQNKTRICIRIDGDLLARFQTAADQSSQSKRPVGYQTLINKALRWFIESEEVPRIIRELPDHGKKPVSRAHKIVFPAPRQRGRPRSTPPSDDVAGDGE